MANSSETVYGTNEEGHVMSEKVSSLATNIYKEFERMIKKYDEDVVKELMPLTVGLLESLDQALADKQEGDVELELLRDDNEQLLTQYEREKQLRKGAEQKYLEMEDLVEGERRELCDKVESMESIIRMLELKSKNSNDHISRLEEKETEMKKEYQKLHDRYTELFRTHCDYMERTKILMGTDKIDLSNSPRTKGFNLPNLRPVSMMLPNQSYSVPKMEGTPASILGMDLMSPRSNADSNVSIKSELGDLDSPEVTVERRRKDKKSTAIDTCDQGQVTDNIDVKEFGTTTKKTNTNVVRSSEKQEEPARVMSTPKQTDIISGSVDSSQGNTNTQSAPKESERSESKMEDSVRTVTLENGEDTKETTEHSMSVDSQTVIANTESDSEPQTHVRLRHSSFVHEEAEFEEDRIPGLDDTIAHIVATTPELQELEESMESQHSRHSNSRRNNDSIFDELQGQDADLGDDFGITGREVAPGEFASSGMGKELENLILENTELMETKNALNIVKDDLIAKVDELSSEMEILREEITSLQTVKAKLHSRIKELEEELKKTKEDLEKKNSAGTEENEDDVPMAQRKRFTRVEMARVLMERNQYKERLMELQEAVRWTEMIRASREHPEMSTPNKQKKSSIWNFFSNLFSSPNKPSKKPLPAATIKYNAPTTQVQPVGDPNKKTRQKLNLGDKAKAYDFLTDDLSSQVEAVLAAEPVIAQPKVSEKAKKEREKERREQYKQVRAHVKKDDGRLQAYGWSLPAKLSAVPSRDSAIKTQVPVPVPVYCRPLFDKDYGLKIWCAAGVNLTGGRTRDGGSVVGASVFYSSPPELEQGTKTDSKDAVEKLNQELKDHEENLKSAHAEQLSSYVWICNQTNSSSRVAVIDANNPGDVLETFRVSMSPILCVASVPGALESDYPVDEEILKAESYPQYKPPEPVDNTSIGSDSGIGGISFVQCATGTASPLHSPVGSPQNSELHGDNLSSSQAELSKSDEKLDASVEYKDKADTDSIMSSRSSRSYEVSQEETQPSVFKAKGSPVSSGTATPTSSASSRSLDRRVLQEQAEMVRDAISPLLDEPVYEDGEKMSSVLPTMWIGTQSGSLYVHSAVTQWRRCLHSVKLRDSVLFIVHLKGRVLAALADGTVAIFHRNQDGEWDVQNYHLLDMGKPHHSIRCMTVIANKHVWCGYGNKIYVVEPREMSIAKIFDAHPRKESQVRQMAWLGDGVWVSIRLDSTLRLYHAYTYQHLQDVDIEPYVSKMLGTGKLGFSFVRITAMLISCNRLWIGTGNGVVISVPLSESNKQTVSTASSGGRPGGIIRVYSDNKTEDVTPSSFTPYCSMAQAQLSFHGHRDAVKFFAAVPGSARKGMSTVTEEQTASNNCRHEAVPAPASHNKLVMSGGEGYVDFRIGDGDEDAFIEDQEKKISLSKGDRSHLIVWEVSSPEQ